MAPLNQPDSPIFILGIMPRSGTAFLYNLLRAHPDCGRAREPIWEDYFVDNAEHLVRYVDSVHARWLAEWGVEEGVKEELLSRLGSGLIGFLAPENPAKRFVAKTPSVRNLSNFFRVFPEARLIVLLRDGRAVVESGVRTFGWNYEWAMREWAAAAATIAQFDRAHKDSKHKYLIVRYEDLVGRLRPEMTRVLRFSGLDAETYDFDAAEAAPVVGSSTFRGEKGESVHWDPVRKDESFEPTERWKSWPRRRVERFDWLAGPYLKQFGYEEEASRELSTFRSAPHRLMDALWWTRRRVTALLRGRRSEAARRER